MADQASLVTAIQEALAQVGTLRALPKGRLAPEFQQWHANMTDKLKAHFGEDSNYYKLWVRQSYAPTHLAATPSELKVYYVRGLDGAARLLQRIMGELNG